MNRPIVVLVVISVGTLISTFDGAAVQMVLPKLHQEFHAPIERVQWIMTALVVAPIAGAATDRTGSRLICGCGLLAVAAGLVLASFAGSSGAMWLIVVAMALCGAGLGAFEGPNSAGALGALHEEDLGIGTATMGLLRNLGMTFGAAMAATLIGYATAETQRGYAQSIVAGAHLAELAGAGAAIVGAVLSAIYPGSRLRPSRQPT